MKRILTVLLAMLIVFTTGLFSLSAVGVPATGEELINAEPDKLLVMTNRFENMLNNNFAYGEELSSVSSLLNAAQLSLLDKNEDGKIANSVLIDFVKDMYGVDAGVYADEGKEVLSRDGYTDILPRGYSIYTHKIVDFHANDDGTFTVYSEVEVESHDGQTEIMEAVSRFVPAVGSRFSYHLISSELLEKENVSVL